MGVGKKEKLDYVEITRRFALKFGRAAVLTRNGKTYQRSV